jgi:hypothetical protein
MAPETMKSEHGEFSVSFSFPTDQSLIDLIRGSRKSITFVGPGMTVGLAGPSRRQHRHELPEAVD